MNRRASWALSILWLIALATPAVAEWQVWTVQETRRVLRDDPAERQSAVSLAAARNEWEGFQILMRSDTPIEAVQVEAGDLRGPEGAVIRGQEARLFRQHQLELQVGSYRNKAFKPGWYPDPLIPFRHPVTNAPLAGARLTAVPFSLPSGQTHGFWVDLYVPPKAKAGTYQGVYRVKAAGGRGVEIPVTLQVWDFELPKVPALRTALGSPAHDLRRYYPKQGKGGNKPPANWDAIEAQCAQLLAEHRINATPPSGTLTPVAQPDGSFRIPSERIDALRRFVDRYHVNALSTPHPASAVKDPVAQRDRLRAWLAAFDRAAKELDRPQVVFYTYLKDEPNDKEEYQYVQKWGPAVKAAKSVVKVLVVEQTWTQDPAWGDLYGAIDIWCPLFCLHKQDSAAKRQALGETIWTYTALCQCKDPTPWWEIDFPLLNYRVPSWMAWGDRMRGILYWSMSYWGQVQDPWTDPKTLDRRKGRNDLLYNGEGTMVYPGQAAGYDGIASSLRLKALRDSIDDYDYLAILEQLGRAQEAERVVRGVTASFFQWNPDPGAYPAARRRLAELILSAGRK